MNKALVKVIALVLLLVLATSILSSCSGNYTSAKPGQCMWCDGYGYASYKGTDGKYHSKTCSHCHGSGRSY